MKAARNGIFAGAAGLVLLLAGCAPAPGSAPDSTQTPAAVDPVTLMEFCGSASRLYSAVANADMGWRAARVGEDEWRNRIDEAVVLSEDLVEAAPSSSLSASADAIRAALQELPAVPEGTEPSQPAVESFGEIKSTCADAGAELVVVAEFGG